MAKNLVAPSFPVDSVFVHFDPFNLGFPGNQRYQSIFGKLHLAGAHPDDQVGSFRGYQLVRLERKSGSWSANNSSVYDEILYPLVKARLYWTKRNPEIIGDTDTPWRHPGIDYYFPVLLTAGEVYTVAITEDAAPLITKVKWAILQRDFHLQDGRTTLLADVVSFESFDEYLRERVHKTASRTCDAIAHNLQFYDPNWLLSNYGRPEKDDVFSEWLKSARKKAL